MMPTVLVRFHPTELPGASDPSFVATPADCTTEDDRHRLARARLDALHRLTTMEHATNAELAEFMLEEVIRLSGSQLGYVHLLAKDEEHFSELTWSRSVRESCAVAFDGILTVSKLEIWTECLRTQAPVLQNHPSHEQPLHLPEGHLPIGRHLCVPVLDKGTIVALAGVANKEHPYDTDDVLHLQVMARDLWTIFARRRTEEVHRQLAHAVERSPAAIIITDIAGTITYVNPAVERSSGYLASELLGRNPRLFHCGDRSRESYADLWSTILSGSIWHGEFHNRRKNGELYWEQASIGPIHGEEGSITGFIAVKEDVTEKKQMIDDLTKAMSRAEKADQLKDAFITSISHEIRTPLNIISGYSQLLHELLPDAILPDQSRILDSMIHAANRLSRTVEHIMNVSSIRTGSFVLAHEKLDVRNELHHVLQPFTAMAKLKGLALRIELPDTPILVVADRYSLRHMMDNILDNAIKFTERGSILVTGSRQDQEWALSVRDTGIGIAEEYLPYLMAPFTQERVGYSRPYEGLGLGMALVRHYAELNGGRIEIQSKKGVGTTITVFFPVPNARIANHEEST